MPAQGGKIRALKLSTGDNADGPSFSPDGKQLVFRCHSSVRDKYTVSLMVANFKDFSLRQIKSISGLDSELSDIMAIPKFSPDGRLIVYQDNDHEPIGGFTIIDLNGKTIASFPFNPKEQTSYSYLGPHFSPDGNEILCWSYDFKQNANRLGNHTILTCPPKTSPHFMLE